MELRKATLPDLLELQTVCSDSYTQIFADHWMGNGLSIYLEQEFGTDRLKVELTNPDYKYFFIQLANQQIGFAKINYKSATGLSNLANCELEKIYILPAHSGKGIGKKALREIIDRVKERGKKELFLCVIDTNVSAIAFYQKMGFQFHSKTRLEVPLFKEELRGMHRMCLQLGEHA